MQAKETLFADLVQGRAQQFQVPLYQRTYSWTEKQLAQLWSDILDQVDLLETGEKASAHFLGSVVLAPSPQNEATFPRWLVVDGQQRLTTISLALAAIRDHLAQSRPDEAERIDEEYLINKRKNENDRFRLLPTQADRPNYAAHIRGTHEGQAAGDNVSVAYRFFRRKLVEAEDPADPQDVLRIEQAITSRLTLVAVTAEAGDNVHPHLRVPQQHRPQAQPGRPAAQLPLHAAAHPWRTGLRDVLAAAPGQPEQQRARTTHVAAARARRRRPGPPPGPVRGSATPLRADRGQRGGH
ncbi:DUF262 domain-containing protein [Streptomyces sp. NBC_01218]|uniref:DUF262 domain-containing protein n=1 Tax=Streptomyces sp. NBC_01218 TaxID=2903780 RepID=UPI002E11170E|nr:DUF262 domain-containing protein [Streptomyces sp. NBC_01218]